MNIEVLNEEVDPATLDRAARRRLERAKSKRQISLYVPSYVQNSKGQYKRNPVMSFLGIR